jgi:predicted  nucleic acid-binding Zn-ribbon protein
MQGQHDTARLDALQRAIDNLDSLYKHLYQDHLKPLDQIAGAHVHDIDELKTQVAIILGNINGISERLERLEQAHANLERQVLDMLTNTLPSSTDRITQIDHQVGERLDALEEINHDDEQQEFRTLKRQVARIQDQVDHEIMPAVRGIR